MREQACKPSSQKPSLQLSLSASRLELQDLKSVCAARGVPTYFEARQMTLWKLALRKFR